MKLTDRSPFNVALLTGLAATFLPVILIEMRVLHFTGGIFSYPLDDTFIHMQVAKNVAFFHNWGINNNEFGSASSSLLYTLLLAGTFRLFSVNVMVPFIINCIAAIILLLVVDGWLRKQGMKVISRAVALFCVAFFAPLPILIVSGMEHTLQTLFAFLFIFAVADQIESGGGVAGEAGRRRIPWSLFVYAMLVTSIRYEGMFLVAIGCLLLLYYRQWRLGFLLGITALLPIIVFGVYSILKGSYFLPNSVLVKSETSGLSPSGLFHYAGNILINKLTVPNFGISSLATQRLLLILPLAYIAFAKELREKKTYSVILVILLGTTLLHLSFAATGWFFRYEAYLVTICVVLLSVLVYKYGRAFVKEKLNGLWIVSLIVLFALFFPFVLRSLSGFARASRACINIYEQQQQMGRFVQKYYDTATVAANDIGAVTFFAHGKVIDLWGLGSIEVARSRKGNYWTPSFLDSLVRAKHTRIAIIFDSWFTPGLLGHWKKAATWRMPNNVISGDDTVTFYAIDAADAEELKAHLREYRSSLPVDVKVTYFE